MSSDIREAVLTRLADLLAGISDFTFTARNLDELPETKRPCAILIDGDENRSTETLGINGQPLMMQMAPIVAIGASQLDGSDLGQAVSSLRAQVIKAVLFDSVLAGIIKPNGGGRGRILYDGLTNKLSHGSILAADAELRFVINYPLKPSDL